MATAAVIFDCDGVLVNSEEIVQRVELRRLSEIGLHYELPEFADRFMGVTEAAFFAGLDADHRARFGKPLPGDFETNLLSAFVEEFAHALVAHDGVAGVVAAISGPKAVASSSGTERLAHKLRLVGLYDAFAPHVYSGDVVANGKPAPDLFLYAAEKLGIAPKACAAVEDSVNGVLSAVAAGMTVIGYVGGRHCTPHQTGKLRKAGAVAVIDHMNQLLPTLAKLG